MCATRRLTPPLSSCVFLFFSDSNAIKAEGLQEGLDWLQGKVSFLFGTLTRLQKETFSYNVISLTPSSLTPILHRLLHLIKTKQ